MYVCDALQARFIFQLLDRSSDGGGDGHIDSHELTYLLVQYSLPPSDVHAIMKKYDKGGDGRCVAARI